MTTDTKHTPKWTLPVKAAYLNNTDFNEPVWEFPIHSSDDLFIDVHGLTKELTEQKAAFIVRACNSHDALVEALKRCYEVFNMDEVDTSVSMQVGMALSKAGVTL